MVRRRRTGFLATLAAGVGLLGVSLHGMTGVDRELKAAVATPAPNVIQEYNVRDCNRGEREHHRHPEV